MKGGDGIVKGTEVRECGKKTRTQLLRAIDECRSLSQLFALIQHENISLRMHSQPGASNLQPRKLGANEITDKKDTPFERLKIQVRQAVENNTYNS